MQTFPVTAFSMAYCLVKSMAVAIFVLFVVYEYRYQRRIALFYPDYNSTSGGC